MVFSISSEEDAYRYGRRAGANLWRTTGDISDNWHIMSEIGFRQDKLASYAGPGHWNDPDMLEVGNGHMTADEYRTHISLWALVAAPLIAGNDLRSMSEKTKSILMNREMIAIDQDSLGRQGGPVSRANGLEIWSRPLSGNAMAAGLFNRTEAPAEMTLSLSDLKEPLAGKAIDLWTHSKVDLRRAASPPLCEARLCFVANRVTGLLPTFVSAA